MKFIKDEEMFFKHLKNLRFLAESSYPELANQICSDIEDNVAGVNFKSKLFFI